MNRPTLILLVGCLGSGKTTYAEKYISEHSNTVHLASDSIRAELWGDESVQGNPAEVFSLMQKRAVEALNSGKDVTYDSTAMTRKDRAGIINICPKFVQIECHIIWALIETCIKRDAARKRTVGKEVIDRMLKRFQMPFVDEGISDIRIIRPEEFDSFMYKDSVIASMKIPHDNPYHTLSIHDHCIAAFDYAFNHNYNWDIREAAMWHDCAKPYVKNFVNTKGEITEIAHYYGHQAASAWQMCGLTENINAIWLTSTHMSPFLNEKYYKNLPPYLKTMVDQLHEADLAAR